MALKSGGPVMLVVDFAGDMFVCAWRGGAGAREATFPADRLWRLTDG
ncbi:MAG: DUF2158 domain-containing protein [Brevundimonas sp.]